MDIDTASVRALSQALREKKISSVELVEHFNQQSADLQTSNNAYITLTPDRALEQARAADKALAQGEAHGLCGIPVAHKDLFCTQGVRTTCGSKLLEQFVPPYNAFVVEQTQKANMPLLGKLNCDEFGMGSSNENSYFGAVKNPYDAARVPGGSSGGSAVAVAAGMAPLVTGTDTGGSIRQPAAFCGITGLKPTYGTVSRYGMVAYASSFDQGGSMAHSAEDCAYLFDTIRGFDKRDSTSINRVFESTVEQLGTDLKGVRIGVVQALLSSGLQPEVAQACQDSLVQLQKIGAELVDVELPNLDVGLPAYYVLAPAEASSNLSRFDGVRYTYRCENPKDLMDLYIRSRSEGFGAEVKRRIMVGTYALSAGYYDAYYLQAQKLRRLVVQDFAKAFEQVDMIFTPTTPNTAFELGTLNADPAAMYLQDVYTIPVNLAGLPAISFPTGSTQGLPIGSQLIGNYFEEGRLLSVVHQFQQNQGMR